MPWPPDPLGRVDLGSDTLISQSPLNHVLPALEGLQIFREISGVSSGDLVIILNNVLKIWAVSHSGKGSIFLHSEQSLNVAADGMCWA